MIPRLSPGHACLRAGGVRRLSRGRGGGPRAPSSAIPPIPGRSMRVAHVLEMEGRQHRGHRLAARAASPIGRRRRRSPSTNGGIWRSSSSSRAASRRCWRSMTSHVRGTPSGALLDLVDAAALLWRLQLAGIDVGERWQGLREHWYAHLEDHVLAFNDAHIAMVAGGLKDRAALERQATAPSPDYIGGGRGHQPRHRPRRGPGRGRGHRRLRRRRFRPRRRSAAAGALRDLAHGRQPCPARPLRPDPDRRCHRRRSAGPWPAPCWPSGSRSSPPAGGPGSNMPRCCNGSAMSRRRARRSRRAAPH